MYLDYSYAEVSEFELEQLIRRIIGYKRNGLWFALESGTEEK